MDWEVAKQGRSRRRGIAAALAAALAVGFLVRVPPEEPGRGELDISTVEPADADAPDAAPRPLASTAVLGPEMPVEPGAWQPAARSPVRVDFPSALHWTGREVLAWGGEHWRSDGRTVAADGAAYDPATNRWRSIARAPLQGRSRTTSVWTGDRLFVWGGNDAAGHRSDGAIYDPVADRWAEMAVGPLSPRSGALGAWTGSELFVLGGHDNNGELLDAAAYDPTTGTWRMLPPLPFGAEGRALHVAASDEGVLVWRSGRPVPARATLAGGPLVWFDRATDRWETVSAPARFAGTPVGAVAWTGEGFLLSQPTNPGLRIVDVRLPERRWREVGRTGRFWQRWVNGSAWTGDSLLLLGDSGLLRFDLASTRWSRVPERTPVGFLWAGDRLFGWGATVGQSDDPDASGRNVQVRPLRG